MMLLGVVDLPVCEIQGNQTHSRTNQKVVYTKKKWYIQLSAGIKKTGLWAVGTVS